VNQTQTPVIFKSIKIGQVRRNDLSGISTPRDAYEATLRRWAKMMRLPDETGWNKSIAFDERNMNLPE
jgi:hypothetical protein